MISVIIPVFNEHENINPLLRELGESMHSAPISEVIYVDDGSTDNSYEVLSSLRKTYPFLRVIRHKKRAGQSAAFQTGIMAAGNKLVVLMDGDGQNHPNDISRLYATYCENENLHSKIMVAGQRKKRRDTLIRRFSSKIANKVRSFILNDHIKDTGCSLKLIRRDDYLRLPYFNHMHRFIPALLIRDNVTVLTVDVEHRARMKGTSKYGLWNRLWVGIIDLLGVKWLLNRGKPRGFEFIETL